MGLFQNDSAGTAVSLDNGHVHTTRAISISRFQTTAWQQNTETHHRLTSIHFLFFLEKTTN